MRSKSIREDRKSLLHPSTPPRLGGAYGDPNVGSIYAKSSAYSDNIHTESSASSGVNRFRAQEHFQQEVDAEMDPNEGALQFVPAFNSSFEEPPPTWDAIIDDKPTPVKPSQPSVTGVRTRGARINRIAASLFANHHQSNSSNNSSRSKRSTSPARSHVVSPAVTAPVSPPSTSSSSFVGWPGTQDRQGATISLGSSDSIPSSSMKKKRREFSPSPQTATALLQPSQDSNDSYTQTNNYSFSESLARNAVDSPERNHTAASTKYTMPEETHVSFDDLLQRATPADPWSSEPSTTATPQSSYSKTSSAYLDMSKLEYPDFQQEPPAKRQPSEHSYRGGSSAAAAAKALLRRHRAKSPVPANRSGHRRTTVVSPPTTTDETAATKHQVPTEENLGRLNHVQPPHRSLPGYLLDKTKEVPSLMDQHSDSSYATTQVVNETASSDVFDNLSQTQSDVFDNVSSASRPYGAVTEQQRRHLRFPESIQEEVVGPPAATPSNSNNTNSRTPNKAVMASTSHTNDDFKLVLLGGGLTAIQSSATGYSNRQTASDYDDNLTNSDVDQYGYTHVPGFSRMMGQGTHGDSALRGIKGNLGITPMRKSAHVNNTSDSGAESESLFSDPYTSSGESYHHSLSDRYYVAPSVMKQLLRRYRRLSAITDTSMTLEELDQKEDESKAFALFEMRSRIMEKDIERGLERRGGTVTCDDIVTTKFYQRGMRIRDAVIVSKAWRDGASPKDVVNTARLTQRDTCTYFIPRHRSWEPVEWVDDTDFLQYKCPSLGSRHMHGFEMFTIGDCQSILLKLTNDRCTELRTELNVATKRQIEAEEIMKDEEGDDADVMMTDAEMTYLSAMEEVKIISRKLVSAEKAFALVRERIEQLVCRYQEMLVKIESESFAGASSILTQSSFYSELEEQEELREQAMWERRAQRAELRAELSAREALVAKEEVRMVQEEKARELDALKLKLAELQSESSYHARDNASALIAKKFCMHRYDDDGEDEEAVSPSQVGISKQKIDGVKQRFRDRMASRKKETADLPRRQRPPRHDRPAQEASSSAELFRSAGEEMYSHLDFYERSLKAVARGES